MYILRGKEFIHTQPSNCDFTEIVEDVLYQNQYEFVVFTESSRDKGLMVGLDPKKVRMLYNEETHEHWVEPGKVISIFQRATGQGLDNFQRIPNDKIYFSRLGFARGEKYQWKVNDTDDVILEKTKKLADLTKERSILFFGNPLLGRVTVMEKIEKLGFKIKRVTVDVKKKSVHDYLLENKCFAVLGMDGMSIGCWRDWEAALSAVPYIRHTNRKISLPFVNPIKSSCLLSGFDPKQIKDGIEQAIHE